jgi:hypothetical protein
MGIVAEVFLQRSQCEHRLVAAGDLLDHHRRRAHHRGGDHEDVVVEIIEFEHGDRLPARPYRRGDHEPADVGIPTTAGSEHGRATGQIGQVGFV